LKDIAPGIKRAGIMFNPDTAPGGGNLFLGWFEAAARSLAVEPVPMRVRSDAQIEAAIAALDHHQASLAAMDDSFMVVHSRTIISSDSVAHNNVPAIFVGEPFVRETRPHLIWFCSAARPAMLIASCAVRSRSTGADLH
jgi:putative tryptophan/tyrosine transport system substrate-binding protein